MSLIRSLARMRRSIGLVQAVAVLCASVMVGLGLGTAQLAQALADHRSTALARCAEILSLAEGGATGAAWTLDAALAQDVVASMVDAHGVQLATLSDEHGNVLASAWSEPHAATLLTRRFADAFLTAPLAASRRLEVSTDRGRRWVGTLTVELSRLHAAGRFLDRAFDTALTSVITALLVGMILLVLSARLVTSPLRRVARRIAEVDPERPQEHSLDVPPGHEHDELGELIRRTNQMLGRLAVTQRDLRRLATRDPLTGLPNRVLIGERLREAIARARRGGLRVAVLFLDLDRFKTINDSLGHETGDQLLVDVSSVLAESVRANDSVGRLGGDEFVVMLEDVNESDVVEQTVRRIVDALDRPFTVHGREVRTTASVGIAVYPDDGEGVTDLMRHADLAMYRAKQAGGSCWRFFAPELAERVTRRLRAETALASARARGELTVDYQAKVTAADGTLVGCEALLRWTHDGERQDANGFIAVAEDSGLILEVGSWVLDEVCRQIAEWGARGHRVPVAVNVSARQLGDAGFVDMVIATLERHGVETGLLSLEITETALMEDPRRCAALLRRLSRLGVRVSIDDFGTGYASLAYLARLPVQELKIDRMFVSRARSSRSILEAIVAMARSLRLETVAEGIETEEQLAMARQAGCDVVQGYRVGRPMDATAFERAHLAGASAGREVNAR